MATTEFSTGKTVFILAIVVGCFAILWPKVFYPMMQAAFTITKPRVNDEQVCCDIIYERNIDLKFFAELCKSVIDRELATDDGIRKHRRDRYPPPGMMERCRKKIRELCHIDIAEALAKGKKGKISIDQRKTSNDPNSKDSPAKMEADQPHLLNLTECLEKHFHLNEPFNRRIFRPLVLPRHVRQERPPHLGAPVSNPALKERGNPFVTRELLSRPVVSKGGKPPSQMSAVRPSLGGSKIGGSSTKGGGAMGFVMPIYTVGIIVFFLYTIMKVLFRRTEDPTPKVMDFHMDPEYRKYVLSEQYENGIPLSYQEYLKNKEKEERKKHAHELLGEKGRKQAVEADFAELDVLRRRLEETEAAVTRIVNRMNTVNAKLSTSLAHSEKSASAAQPEDDSQDFTVSEDDSRTRSDAEGPREEGEEDDEEVPPSLVYDGGVHSAVKPSGTPDELVAELSKIAVMGLDLQAEFPHKPLESEDSVEAEVSNIILEASVPSDTQLLVAESQSLTHTTADHIDGWSESDEQPVIVTGKMTISLLGKEATVHSTDSKSSLSQKRSPTPSKGHDVGTETDEGDHRSKSGREREQIEELANALVEDILHNQVPKVLAVDGNAHESQTMLDSIERRKKFALSTPNTDAGASANSQGKQTSRESANSQGSSFEYLSAADSSFAASAGSPNTFEMVRNERNQREHAQQRNGGSPMSIGFECISTTSLSPLSPEGEASFEKLTRPSPEAETNGDVGSRVASDCSSSSNRTWLSPIEDSVEAQNEGAEATGGVLPMTASLLIDVQHPAGAGRDPLSVDTQFDDGALSEPATPTAPDFQGTGREGGRPGGESASSGSLFDEILASAMDPPHAELADPYRDQSAVSGTEIHRHGDDEPA